MTRRLSVAEAHRVDRSWFVDVAVEDEPARDVHLEQLETTVRVTLRTDARGRATARLRLPVVEGVPFSVLRIVGTEDVATIGGEHVRLADVLASRSRPRPGAVVTAFGGLRAVTSDLRLDRCHLVLGPGTTLRLGNGVGIRCSGGSVRALGTADQPVVFEAAGRGWANLTLMDSLRPSRLVHCTFAGGRGAAVDEAHRRLVGDATVGGAIAALHIGGLELRDVAIEACEAGLGGGLYALGSELRCERVRFVGTRADHGGGLAVQHVRGLLRALSFERNLATAEGDAVFSCMSPDLRIETPGLADGHVAVFPSGTPRRSAGGRTA